MHAELRLTLVAGAIALFASLLGVTIADLFARLRERRQRETDKRLLAGALAAELRGLLERWEEIVPREPMPAAPIFIGWAAEESYFSVYDGAGHRLYLLPREVTAEVVACYTRAKAVLDTLRVAGSLHERFLLMNPSERVPPTAAKLHEASLKYAQDAVRYGELLAKGWTAHPSARANRRHRQMPHPSGNAVGQGDSGEFGDTRLISHAARLVSLGSPRMRPRGAQNRQLAPISPHTKPATPPVDPASLARTRRW